MYRDLSHVPVVCRIKRIVTVFNNRRLTVTGVDLESVVTRESGAISSSLSSLAQAPATASVPVIVRRCIEEVERRGLDIIGLYRLCGSASKKRILREAFERNPRTVDLSPDNVPDINVITGQTIAMKYRLSQPLCVDDPRYSPNFSYNHFKSIVQCEAWRFALFPLLHFHYFLLPQGF